MSPGTSSNSDVKLLRRKLSELKTAPHGMSALGDFSMNRITKKISLALISSSLVMHGCDSPPETLAERDDFSETTSETSSLVQSGSSSGTSSGTSSSYHHRSSGWAFLPWFFSSGNYNRTGVSGMSNNTHGVSNLSRGNSSSFSSSPSTHPSTTSHSSPSTSTSSRGGFGSTSHAVSS
jgi:hypothetical protein